jgi:hypothetical protein
MIELNLQYDDFDRMRRRASAAVDQMPFALSVAMNNAAFNTRRSLIAETWPQHVQQRNPRFLSAALRVNKANKNNLRVEIYDTLGRAHLGLHAHGGTKYPRGTNLAVPQPAIAFTSHGPRKSQTPKAIIANTPKRALRITRRGIFVGKGGRLYSQYAFAREAQIKPDVPFAQDFARSMSEQVRTSFPDAMARAMKGRLP